LDCERFEVALGTTLAGPEVSVIEDCVFKEASTLGLGIWEALHSI